MSSIGKQVYPDEPAITIDSLAAAVHPKCTTLAESETEDIERWFHKWGSGIKLKVEKKHDEFRFFW